MVMEDYEMEKEEQRQSDELKRSATDIARQAGVAAVLAADEEAAVAVGPQTLA